MLQQTSNVTDDEMELLRLKIHARTALINKISGFPITSMDSLDQTNELLVNSVDSPKEIELNTLVRLSPLNCCDKCWLA